MQAEVKLGRGMGWLWAVLAVFFALCASPGAAWAQQALYFPAENFGSANKSVSESSVNQKQLEVLINRQEAFEQVFDLEDQDIFRRAGRAVGLLDLLVRLPDGREANTTCTATLIAPDRAITNYHCVPGLDFRTTAAQLRLGFLDRVRAPGQGYKVRLPAIEANKALDYAIVAVEGVPASRFPPIAFAAIAPRDRQSLYLLHHPAGQPQRLTRLRCQAGQPAINAEGDLLHHCDTLGGSSGALVLAVENGRVTGLHKAGVPDPVRPFNLATPAPKVFAASTELKRLATVGAQPPPATVVPAPAASVPAATTGIASADGVRPGQSFRDCAECPEMVAIPGGTFLMGSPESEEGRDSDEGPQRRVTIAPFAAGKFEVTFAEWDACVAGGGCNGYRPNDQGWGRGRRPVINVSWDDAQAYVQWLSRKTGQRYRLLSEAEWEYAARAGTSTRWGFGDDHAMLPDFAWYEANAGGQPHPSGEKKPNLFGLYDLLGNVWEWVQGCSQQVSIGGDLNARLSGLECEVSRGGSWGNVRNSLRLANRLTGVPQNRVDVIGFRVARPR